MFQSKALIVFSNGGSTALTDNVLILKKSSRRIFVFKWHSSRETNPSVCLSEFLLHFRCVTLVEILNVVFFFWFFFSFPSLPSPAFWAGSASNTEFHFIFSLVQCTINYQERAFKLHNIPDRWARHATGKTVSPYNSSLCLHTTADYSFHARQKWICAG